MNVDTTLNFNILFWFVYKKAKPYKWAINLFYNWNITTIDLTMDEDWAVKWYQSIDQNCFKEVSMRIYGRDTKINLPLLPELVDETKNITINFIDYITEKALNNFLDDTPKQYILELLRFYNIVLWTDGGVYLKEKLSKQIDDERKKQDITSEENAIITVCKEWLDWYYSFNKYKITKDKEVSIWQDYNIKFRWEDLWTIKWTYTPALRRAMFNDKTDFNTDNRTLEKFQYTITKKLGWMNFISAPRRSWKTWYLAFVAWREIVRMATSKQERNRPIRVLYIWLSDAKNKAARDYILNMSKKYRASGMFKWRWEEQRLIFTDYTWDPLWVVDFISAKSYEAWVWEYADLILIDEAARIKEDIYSAILPIVTNEWARLICVSTLVWNTKKNWFYRELVKAERDEFLRWDINTWIIDKRKQLWLNTKDPTTLTLDELYAFKFNILEDRFKVGMRFTIDDIEHISDKQKELAKQELAQYPDRYLAELYSVFSNESKVFQYETCLREPDKIVNITFEYMVFAYDPAIKWDIWAVIVMWYNRTTSRLYVIAEREMPKDTYNKHPEVLQDIKSEFVHMVEDKNMNKMYVVADITGNYWLLSLFEVKWYYIDCKVHYTSWERPHQDKDWIWKAPKEHLVQTLKDVIDSSAIIINSECTKLINEMNYFQMITNDKTWNTKYEAVEWHDDYVNACMTGTLFVYHVMSEKYKMLTTSNNSQKTTLSTEEVLALIDIDKKKTWVDNYEDKYRKFLNKNMF